MSGSAQEFAYISSKRCSTRVRKLLQVQRYKCACGELLDTSRYFDADTKLICGHCAIKRMNARGQG